MKTLSEREVPPSGINKEREARGLAAEGTEGRQGKPSHLGAESMGHAGEMLERADRGIGNHAEGCGGGGGFLGRLTG